MASLFGWISRHQVWQKIGILVVFGAAVYLILPELSNLENSWQLVASMARWAVMLAFFAKILSYLGNGFLLQGILSIARQKVPLWRSTLIVLGSYSLGMIAGVVGNSAAIYRWTGGRKGSMQGATLASIYLPQFNIIMLVLISIFGLGYLILTRNLTQIQIIGFSAALFILALIGGGAALVLRFRHKATSAILWISSRVAHSRRKSFDPNSIRNELGDLFSAWDALLQGAWRRIAVGAFLNIAFDFLTLYFLFVAMGEKISLGVLLAGYGLPLLLGKVAFILPGGVGVVEGSMTALYTQLGIPPATAVVVVLGYRLISFWIPAISGFPIAAYLERSQTRHPYKEGMEG